MNIPIVYEDDHILVVNKPSGLLTVPTPKKETRTLTSILNLYPCHRLDRETSGLIIFALAKSVQKKIMQLFNTRQVKKTYTAFVQGNLSRMRGEIKIPLEGLTASTRYRVLARRKNFSIIEASPATGRTNQIRIHFKLIGHPLVGESRFAFRRDFALRAKRVMLHAEAIEFRQPLTGKHLKLQVDLPADMREFLAKHP